MYATLLCTSCIQNSWGTCRTYIIVHKFSRLAVAYCSCILKIALRRQEPPTIAESPISHNDTKFNLRVLWWHQSCNDSTLWCSTVVHKRSFFFTILLLWCRLMMSLILCLCVSVIERSVDRVSSSRATNCWHRCMFPYNIHMSTNNSTYSSDHFFK